MSNDLTIVIPTYERPKYLERSINFWKNYDFNVLYLDGSINAQNDLDLPTHIRYIHSNSSLQQRLIMSTREVKTPYVCFLSDDEFFIPNVLLRMISQLDINEEFVSIGAGCASFNFKNQILELNLKYNKMQMEELELPNIKIRLKSHFQDYLPRTIYGMHRAKIWRNAVLASDLECNIPDRAFEIIFEFMIVAQGKVKILPEIHWLRSTENQSIGAKVNSEFDFFHNWWMSNQFISERKLVIASITKKLDLSGELDIEFESLIENTFRAYSENSKIKMRNVKKNRRIVKMRKYYMTGFRFLLVIRKYLRLDNFKISNRKSPSNLEQFRKEASVYGFDFIDDEINVIQNFLRGFSTSKKYV